MYILYIYILNNYPVGEIGILITIIYLLRTIKKIYDFKTLVHLKNSKLIKCDQLH